MSKHEAAPGGSRETESQPPSSEINPTPASVIGGSFYGDWDEPQERRGKISFQQWLDRHHKDRGIRVVEFPTYDGIRVPEATLRAVECKISRLLSAGRTVVLMDSGGIERTRQVCMHMGFVENTGLVENRPV